MRSCADCGVSIEGRHFNARLCPACKKTRQNNHPSKRRYEIANADRLKESRRLRASAKYRSDPEAGRIRASAQRHKDIVSSRAKERARYWKDAERLREKCRLRAAAKYKANPAKARANARAVRAKNLTQERLRARVYAKKKYQESPERRVELNRLRRARASNAPGDGVPIKAWREILEVFDHRCAYCLSKEKLTMDHVDPLATGGAHDTSNVVPACNRCNQGKKDRRLWFTLRYSAATSSSSSSSAISGNKK